MIECTDTGEIVDTYQEYLLTKHWTDFKVEYYKSHPKKCSECGSRKKIHLHHLSYDNIGCETDADVIHLCSLHHAVRHSRLTQIEALRIMLSSEPFILVYPAIVKFFGSVNAAIYFEHLRYQSEKHGDEDGWTAFTKAKITKATTLTRVKQDRVRRQMRDAGVLEEKLKKDHRGIPVLHQRVFAQKLKDLIDART